MYCQCFTFYINHPISNILHQKTHMKPIKIASLLGLWGLKSRNISKTPAKDLQFDTLKGCIVTSSENHRAHFVIVCRNMFEPFVTLLENLLWVCKTALIFTKSSKDRDGFVNTWYRSSLCSNTALGVITAFLFELPAICSLPQLQGPNCVKEAFWRVWLGNNTDESGGKDCAFRLCLLLRIFFPNQSVWADQTRLTLTNMGYT